MVPIYDENNSLNGYWPEDSIGNVSFPDPSPRRVKKEQVKQEQFEGESGYALKSV